jgi:hypothetical protein
MVAPDTQAAALEVALGGVIRDELTLAEIPLTAVVDATGIPYATLWRHLHKGGLTTAEVHDLAQVLNTSVAALVVKAASAGPSEVASTHADAWRAGFEAAATWLESGGNEPARPTNPFSELP